MSWVCQESKNKMKKKIIKYLRGMKNYPNVHHEEMLNLDLMKDDEYLLVQHLLGKNVLSDCSS